MIETALTIGAALVVGTYLAELLIWLLVFLSESRPLGDILYLFAGLTWPYEERCFE